MLVKIMNKKENRTKVYEAESVDVGPSPNNPEQVDIWIERIEDSFTFTVPRDGTHEVFLMNSEDGRTIDRFQLYER